MSQSRLGWCRNTRALRRRVGTLGVALVLASGCQSREQVGQEQAPVYGSVSYGDDCTSDMRDFVDKTVEYGRIAGLSDAFAQCMDEAMRTGINRNGFAMGPYRECALDPWVGETIDTQIDKALGVTRTSNDLSISCTGGDAHANASTHQDDGYDHTNPETFAWAGWLSDRMESTCWRDDPVDCTSGNTVWPFDQAAGIVWHEASHTHHYSHGANDQDAAKVACGYPDATDTEWHFQVNTIPYIIGGCMGYVLNRSAKVCQFESCGPDSLHIINDLDETGCSCIRDPSLTGGPEAGPARADLVPTLATISPGISAEVTVANRGTVPALGVRVRVLAVWDNGTTTSAHGSIIELASGHIDSIDAGASVVVSLSAPPIRAVDGVIGAAVTVDPDQRILESDEDNNTLRTALALPDLAPVALSATMERLQIVGSVEVMNGGTFRSAASTVNIVLARDLGDYGDFQMDVPELLPGQHVTLPYVFPLQPYYFGDTATPIGPESAELAAVADFNRDEWESDESDNRLQVPIAWPDLSVAAATAPGDHDGFFGAHHLEIGYQIDNHATGYANLFRHEVRVEDRSGTVLASVPGGLTELAAGGSLVVDPVALDFTDTSGSLSCNGHSYNEYRVRVLADPPDTLGELREDNNEVSHRFVTTLDRPPTVAVADPGTLSFAVTAPDQTVSFVVSATTSDPDGDPVDLTWSSDDLAWQGGSITPGPGPGQATVTMSAEALSALRCPVPGAKTVVDLHITATADDCILEATDTRQVAVELEMVSDGQEPPDQTQICELAYRGVDQLEIELFHHGFIHRDVCPYADPQGGGMACTGLSWLNILADRWRHTPVNVLPPAALNTLSRLRGMVANLPAGLVQSWDRQMALAELDGMLKSRQLTGGAISAVVLERAVVQSVLPLFQPTSVEKGQTARASLFGFTLDLGGPALASGPLGLVPTDLAPAVPKGMTLLSDAPVMAVVTPGRLGKGATISYKVRGPGKGIRLIGFGPGGATDITTGRGPNHTVTGYLPTGLWGVGVATLE